MVASLADFTRGATPSHKPYLLLIARIRRIFPGSGDLPQQMYLAITYVSLRVFLCTSLSLFLTTCSCFSKRLPSSCFNFPSFGSNLTPPKPAVSPLFLLLKWLSLELEWANVGSAVCWKERSGGMKICFIRLASVGTNTCVFYLLYLFPKINDSILIIFRAS